MMRMTGMMMRMMHESYNSSYHFLPTCGLPWVNVMRIKIKVDDTIKR